MTTRAATGSCEIAVMLVQSPPSSACSQIVSLANRNGVGLLKIVCALERVGSRQAYQEFGMQMLGWVRPVAVRVLLASFGHSLAQT